jgi:hypothetical protein
MTLYSYIVTHEGQIEVADKMDQILTLEPKAGTDAVCVVVH